MVVGKLLAQANLSSIYFHGIINVGVDVDDDGDDVLWEQSNLQMIWKTWMTCNNWLLFSVCLLFRYDMRWDETKLVVMS